MYDFLLDLSSWQPQRCLRLKISKHHSRLQCLPPAWSCQSILLFQKRVLASSSYKSLGVILDFAFPLKSYPTSSACSRLKMHPMSTTFSHGHCPATQHLSSPPSCWEKPLIVRIATFIPSVHCPYHRWSDLSKGEFSPSSSQCCRLCFLFRVLSILHSAM